MAHLRHHQWNRGKGQFVQGIQSLVAESAYDGGLHEFLNCLVFLWQSLVWRPKADCKGMSTKGICNSSGRIRIDALWE